MRNLIAVLKASNISNNKNLSDWIWRNTEFWEVLVEDGSNLALSRFLV
jgi:hypothetical protein